MKIRHYLSASILAIAVQSAFGEVINIPQSALLPPGDPGRVSWIASDAGLSGTTTVKLIVERTGTAIANSFLLDVQNNGFPAPPAGGSTDDVVVFGPGDIPGAMATVDIPSNCGLALFHDVYDETGVFLSGPDGILNQNPIPGTSDAYLSSTTGYNYTIEGTRQLVKYYLVSAAHRYQFTSQWGAVTQLGSGFRAFIFLDDDHTPNYDYDDIIIGVLAPPCVDNAECSDGDVCNGEESCVESVCHAGEPVVCDDGDFCNGAETCVNGACDAGSPPTCDDAIACTEDSCEANQCVHTPHDAHCPNDGVFCNGTESCDALLGCVSLGSPCEVGAVCEEATDLCRACQNDGECDDSNSCTLGHACVEGSCLPSVPVDCSTTGNQCMAASCDPNGELGNCDVLTPVQNGTICIDGLFCTTGDTCQGGVCGGSARNCSALSNQCNTGVCNDEVNACVPQPVANGTACNDGNACHVGEACQAGTCQGGSEQDCSTSGDQCNTASCDPSGLEGNCHMLTPVEDGITCDDDDPCTTNDACGSGVCVSPRTFIFDEWSAFAACLAGPEDGVAEECECYDLNDDGHVDMLDVDQFMQLFAGQ